MSRSLLIGAVVVLAVACKPKAPARSHPGCPGEAYRSADSTTDCECGNGKVLRAGALECEKCDPTRSVGLFCDCNDGNVFSFDGQLEVTLGLTSEQVSCATPSNCEAGTRYDARQQQCMPCAANECGASCGQCPVGMSCVSGVCTVAAVCTVSDIDLTDQNSSGDACAWGPGEIAAAAGYDSLPPGLDCSFADDKCTYSAQTSPLGGWEPSCPQGAKRSANDPNLCVCKDETKVMRSGSLECESCDPVASQGLYCDCGENAVFSNYFLTEVAYAIVSDRAKCVAPSECGDGQRLDELSGSCVACGANECGQGCPLCLVGATCISGTCVDAAAGRVTAVLGPVSAEVTECILGEGSLVPLGLITDYVPGQTYEYVEYDGCGYQVQAEALSR